MSGCVTRMVHVQGRTLSWKLWQGMGPWTPCFQSPCPRNWETMYFSCESHLIFLTRRHKAQETQKM